MPTSRQLSDPLRQALETLNSQLRVALPARVERYDYTTQRADVKPVLNRHYADGTVEEMPVITGVPMVWPRSGGASLTMPVNRGDGVLLVFSDRSLDLWLTRGGITTPDDRRKHDLSDAIAIPGLYPFTVVSPAENNEDVLLQFSGSQVRLKPGGNVEIDSATAVTINTGDVVINVGGDVTVTGGDVIADGISLKTHVHGGVATGGGTTGAPQ